MTNLTNLTADQQEAIDFFAEYEQYVNNFGLGNLDREDRLVFRKGKKLMQAVLDLKTTADRFRYTKDELTQIVKLYLINDNRQFVSSRFTSANPTQPHTVDSIESVCAQLECLDVTRPNQSEWQVKKLVMEVAHELDYDRFSAIG